MPDKIKEEISFDEGKLILYECQDEIDSTRTRGHLRLNMALFDKTGKEIPLEWDKNIPAQSVYGPFMDDFFVSIKKKNKKYSEAYTWSTRVYSISHKTGVIRYLTWTK